MEIAYRFGFDAAHRFAHYPDGHQHGTLHGHSFQVEIALRGEPDPRTGFVADFAEVERACADVRSALDHRLLNDVEGLVQPSLERICVWIWDRLASRLGPLARVAVGRESCGQRCTYFGPGA